MSGKEQERYIQRRLNVAFLEENPHTRLTPYWREMVAVIGFCTGGGILKMNEPPKSFLAAIPFWSNTPLPGKTGTKTTSSVDFQPSETVLKTAECVRSSYVSVGIYV